MIPRQGLRVLLVLLVVFLAVPGWAQQEDAEQPDEPELPPGLEQPEEPELPPGPGDAEEPVLPPGLGDSEEPTLPPGLDEEGQEEQTPGRDERTLAEKLPEGLHGFAEARIGPRIHNDPEQSKDFTLAEIRLEVAYQRAWRRVSFDAKGDLILDAVLNSVYTDLRQMRLTFRPAEPIDVQVGRMVLTWGTGDLLFINDLFPKDWHSFFIGREEEYLKAPMNAVRVGLFMGEVSLDLVYVPRLDPDRYISGERISFWDAVSQRFRGEDLQLDALEPDDPFADDEIAARIYGNVGSYELAGYAYGGFWKSPAGIDPATMQATFPPLNVWGGSVRGPAGPGIVNFEAGYYDSRDDPDGSDPFVRNSEFRFLAGYEMELARELTGGFQYYLEHMIDHDAYLASLPGGEPRDENRHLLTTRITKFFNNQTVIASLFLYYSPSDRDGYLRPKLVWKRTDHQIVEFGANIFFGREDYTFFGQFENASNVYGSFRFQL